MGFTHAVVLSSTSFFLGVIFIAFNVDRRILYNSGTPSDSDYADAIQFYTMFYDAPMAIKALLHAVGGLGLLGLVAKLVKWDESALFFDGSSLGAFMIGIVIYISVTIPTLKTVVAPLEVDTVSDRQEATAVLAAGNTLIALALFALLALQAGQEYARRMDARETAKAAAQEALSAQTEKKTQ